MRRPPILLVPLAACTQGGLDPSLIEDVQVVAMVAEPAEPTIGDATSLTITVADPLGREPELLVWACTPVAGACMEASWLLIDERLALPPLVDGTATYEQVVPHLDVAEDAVIEPRLWALACEPGLCPIVDDAREALETGHGTTALEADLAHPESWMADLPWDGVSLATHTYRASTLPDVDRNHNPLYEARFPGADDELVVGPGEALDVAFWSGDFDGDALRAWASTTAGSFPEPEDDIVDNAVRFYWIAPDHPQEGEIYVVFEDGRGGSALYRQRVRVE